MKQKMISYSRDPEDDETNVRTADQEMDLALKTLADNRAKLYKQLAEVDVLHLKAGELSRKVMLQCSFEYEEEPDSVPFFVEAFQQHLADIDAGGKDPHTLIHCFPATQTGIRSTVQGSKQEKLTLNSDGSPTQQPMKKKSLLPIRPNPAQIQISPVDLFS